MDMQPRVRAFVATSLDGFIAGPNDELDWLQAPDGVEDTFNPFFKQIGAMLMGRRTYEVVSDFEGAWPYGDTPVLVATHRPSKPDKASVTCCGGAIGELIEQAKAAAGGKDVYIDGGQMIRQALDAGLIDELTITLIPVVLGDGIPLLRGADKSHKLELVSQRAIGGGLVELVYRPRRD